MNEFLKRLVVGLISACIAFGAISFAFSPIGIVVTSVLTILVGAFASLEFAGIAQKKNLDLSKKTLVTASACYLIASLISAFFIELYFLPTLVFAAALLCFFYRHRNPSHQPLHHISASALSLIYIALPLSFALQVLYSPYIVEDGRLWILYLILVVKFSDITAYFIGKSIGKHPLSIISPNKTKEGLAGAIIGGFVLSVAFSILARSMHLAINLDMVTAMILGLILPILGQLGDLSESLFKRDAGLKDSAHIPGFGGILDMIDSLIFTTPLLYFYIKFTHAL